MYSNNSGTNRKSEINKRADLKGMKTEVASEIGFPNNKDKGKGKKGGMVGKG